MDEPQNSRAAACFRDGLGLMPFGMFSTPQSCRPLARHILPQAKRGAFHGRSGQVVTEKAILFRRGPHVIIVCAASGAQGR